MEDILISILESVGYEAYRQGSFTDGDKYPEHFFTFWNNSSEEAGYYDILMSIFVQLILKKHTQSCVQQKRSSRKKVL